MFHTVLRLISFNQKPPTQWYLKSPRLKVTECFPRRISADRWPTRILHSCRYSAGTWISVSNQTKCILVIASASMLGPAGLHSSQDLASHTIPRFWKPKICLLLPLLTLRHRHIFRAPFFFFFCRFKFPY